jgi:Type II secretion system (T2SS), protein E, N-terminal domain
MADMPGALLLRTGVLRPADLTVAAALQEQDGGSFGECLVRLGFIDEEALAEFYKTRLMIPRVPNHRLVDVSKKVLALVQADMAAEFRVLPIELDGDGLVLAMADPTDNHAVDEVSFFADRFIVRVVATESGVRDGIERHYGVRFTSPRAADRYGARIAQAMKHKPGPSTEAPPDRPPNPSPPPPKPKEPPPAAKPSKEELEEQIVLLTQVKHRDDTPLPMPMPPPDDYEPLYALDEPILLTQRKETPPERKRSDTLPGFAQMTVPDPPLARLRASRDRDEIAAAVLDYVALLMRRGAFFVMKKSILIGHDARGTDIDRATVRKLVINVEAPSLFRDVIASRLPYRGPLPETPANRAFAHALGGVSTEVLVMPVAVRDRVIAVLFADGAAQPLPDAALHATVREAGLAYERLILEAKAQTR